MNLEFLLDTNVLSELARPRPDPGVSAWLSTQAPIRLAAITLYELSRGVQHAPVGRRRRFLEEWLAALLAAAPEVVPFDGRAALVAASIDQAARRAGRPIPDRDLFILATARSQDLGLATRNLADFRGHGVSLYDPFADTRVPG